MILKSIFFKNAMLENFKIHGVSHLILDKHPRKAWRKTNGQILSKSWCKFVDFNYVIVCKGCKKLETTRISRFLAQGEVFFWKTTIQILIKIQLIINCDNINTLRKFYSHLMPRFSENHHFGWWNPLVCFSGPLGLVFVSCKK